MRGSTVCRAVRSLALAGAALAAALTPAAAHPHVFVTARSAFVIDASGKITGIRHVWAFDEAYSAFAVTGMKTGKDGRVERAALEDLAKINVESLSEFKYFTSLKQGRKEIDFADPAPGYFLEHDGKALTLNFLLPLKAAIPADSAISLKVDDETIFVAFSFAADNPVTVEGTSPCVVALQKPKKSLDSSEMTKLSEDFFSNLKQGFSNDYATVARLSCK